MIPFLVEGRGGGKIDSGYIGLYMLVSVHRGSCGVALWITSHKHIQEGSVLSSLSP